MITHRHFVALPFVVLLVAAVVGGQLNTVDAKGRVIDDSTGLPIGGVSITYGSNKGAVSGEDGSYFIPNLPRGARLRTRMPGYPPTNPPAEASEIRLVPGSLTVQVNEEGTDEKRVPNPEARQGDKLLAKGTESGNMVITTVELVGQRALICATGYASKEIELRGVTLIMTLAKQEGGACPPLPSPSPSIAPATPAPSTPAPTSSP